MEARAALARLQKEREAWETVEKPRQLRRELRSATAESLEQLRRFEAEAEQSLSDLKRSLSNSFYARTKALRLEVTTLRADVIRLEAEKLELQAGLESAAGGCAAAQVRYQAAASRASELRSAQEAAARASALLRSQLEAAEQGRKAAELRDAESAEWLRLAQQAADEAAEASAKATLAMKAHATAAKEALQQTKLGAPPPLTLGNFAPIAALGNF